MKEDAPALARLIAQMDSLLKDPDTTSTAVLAERVYELGYIAGKEMVRRLLRLQLGLGTPRDHEDF